MTTLGIFVRLEAKPGNPHAHVGSMRVKATKQHPQNLRTCRQHGTWPGFWQLASVHGCPFCMACSPQSDTSSTPSAISSIAMACRKDWHSRCTSLWRGNACNALGTSHHRMFPLAMVTLLACWFWIQPDSSRSRCSQQLRVSRGRFNRSGITQHRRVTQRKQLDC
jgi:hypothetical protein